MTTRFYTIGHSTRGAEEMIDLLQAHGIAQLADVRTVPRSRTNPQFNSEDFAQTLQGRGLRYRHFPLLGGLRRPNPELSVNLGWNNLNFRGYADYMQTPQFWEALDELMAWAEEPTATMCAEAVPWRCHRSLVADALLVRGETAVETISPTSARPHVLTRFAVVDDGRVTYPREGDAV